MKRLEGLEAVGDLSRGGESSARRTFRVRGDVATVAADMEYVGFESFSVYKDVASWTL